MGDVNLFEAKVGTVWAQKVIVCRNCNGSGKSQIYYGLNQCRETRCGYCDGTGKQLKAVALKDALELIGE